MTINEDSLDQARHAWGEGILEISKVYEKIDVLGTKQGRAEGVNKIREEIKKAVNKERYLSKEDSKLLNQFISKIVTEISESN